MVVLAQLVSAPDCGSGGHRFDSDIPPHRLTRHECFVRSIRADVSFLFHHIPNILGCRQAVRQRILIPSCRWFESSHPSQQVCCLRNLLIKRQTSYDPLAQSVEHLTFNQGVRSSNLRWVTRKAPLRVRKGACIINNGES